MCEADAYLIEKDKTEMVMSSVDVIEPEGEGNWRLVNIFGEQKTIQGRIKSMNLVDHKIMFESC